jgi:glycosyltransferase involved in cell wall biosynthesis
LLYIGRLISLKSVSDLVQMIADGEHQEAVTLTVAGDGPERDRIIELAAAQRVDVRMLGALKRASLSDVYRQHDFLVLPSLSDEWGLVVVESLRNGVPVIGSVRSQAVLELIDDSNGIQFDPLSKSSFGKALRQAIEVEPADYREMSRRAHLSAVDLTPGRMAQQFMEVARIVRASGDE